MGASTAALSSSTAAATMRVAFREPPARSLGTDEVETMPAALATSRSSVSSSETFALVSRFCGNAPPAPRAIGGQDPSPMPSTSARRAATPPRRRLTRFASAEPQPEADRLRRRRARVEVVRGQQAHRAVGERRGDLVPPVAVPHEVPDRDAAHAGHRREPLDPRPERRRLLATPAMHDLEPAARRDGKVQIGIGIKRSELDGGGPTRQREPHRLRQPPPPCAVVEQQLRPLGASHADRHVQVPVGRSELTGGDSRDRPGQRNPLRLTDPTLAVAGEQIETPAARRGKHVSALIVVEVARLQIADRLRHAHHARSRGDPLRIEAPLDPLEHGRPLRRKGIGIAALNRVSIPAPAPRISDDQVRRTIAVKIRSPERARTGVTASQRADQPARPLVRGTQLLHRNAGASRLIGPRSGNRRENQRGKDHHQGREDQIGSRPSESTRLHRGGQGTGHLQLTIPLSLPGRKRSCASFSGCPQWPPGLVPRRYETTSIAPKSAAAQAARTRIGRACW